MQPKIITFYLPQFHAIPENDEWWGDGFTEWTNVKKSKPLYKGHYQPEIPLNNNYYCLLDSEAQEWQSKLAQKYGVYGFCYYHYWFNGKLLLQKPMENMLINPKINIHFCISWANESWSRTWTGKEKEVLIKQESDDEEMIKKHFEYLLPFFKDQRYIKIDNKPLFIIYKPHLMPNVKRELEIWNELAINNGFDGIYFGHQSCESFDYDMSMFDFGIEFEPFYTRAYESKSYKNFLKRMIHFICHPSQLFQKIRNRLSLGWVDNYDRITKIACNRNADNHSYLGAFPSWDNTPRKGKKSYIVKGSTPLKFENYLTNLLKKNRAKDKNNDFIFINAWNEWAEGAHLEPSELYKFSYLEAVKNSLEKDKSYGE